MPKEATKPKVSLYHPSSASSLLHLRRSGFVQSKQSNSVLYFSWRGGYSGRVICFPTFRSVYTHYVRSFTFLHLILYHIVFIFLITPSSSSSSSSSLPIAHPHPTMSPTTSIPFSSSPSIRSSLNPLNNLSSRPDPLSPAQSCREG